MNPSTRYSYQDAGFNSFMSRSRKSNPLAMTLSDKASSSSGTTVNFDRQQVAGAFGNTAQIGSIALDGVNGDILLNDGTNDRLLIGTQDGGFA